jgi:hypothetical protein
VPEYDRRKIDISHSLEGRIVVDPLRQPLRRLDMAPDKCLEALDTKIPDHKPQLERPEPATKGDSVIHQIHDIFSFADYKEFGYMLERPLQQIRA